MGSPHPQHQHQLQEAVSGVLRRENEKGEKYARPARDPVLDRLFDQLTFHTQYIASNQQPRQAAAHGADAAAEESER